MRGLFLALVLLALAWSPMPAQSKKNQVKGVVHQLDATQGTITVQTGSGPKVQMTTFNLASPDLPVTDISGKPLKLDAIRVGQPVVLTTPETAEVAAIRALPTKKFGKVTRIDIEKRQLELRTGQEVVQYTLGGDLRVERNQRRAPLTDVRVGLGVNVSYLPGTNEVVFIRWAGQTKK